MVPRIGKNGFWARLRSDPALAGVQSTSELERTFQCERARVDRGGSVFSMVVFVPAGEIDDAEAVGILRERMRMYDTIGQLDARRFAVLLPDTDPDGAWTFADDALATCAEREMRFNCEVYCYPLDWEERDSDDIFEEQRANGTDDANSGSGAGLRALHVAAPRRATLARIRRDAEGRPVGDLTPAFLEPLPLTKRVIDVCVSGTLLILLAPLLAIAAFAVKLTSPGSIIFRQQRAGRGGVPFTFYKFRSMYVDAEARQAALAGDNEHDDGPIFKMRNDPRITPVGKFLRRASIDELPQLFNVLKGDMTLIGPRPPTLNEVEEYQPWQRRRLDIMGGLTCIWQVSGRSEIGFEDWVRMDIEYQRKRSLAFDVKLLLRTFGAVFSGRGAY